LCGFPTMPRRQPMGLLWIIIIVILIIVLVGWLAGHR
jgi:flagellar basal body-associated protein FliL